METDRAGRAAPHVPLDIARLRKVISEDIAGFKAELDAPRLTHEIEMRRHSVNFWARFLPEVFDDELKADMAAFLDEVRARPSYSWEWYYRCFHMDVAMYSVTGDYRWIRPVLGNAGHGTSDIRLIALEAMATVAERLNLCEDSLFRRAIRRNFESWQFYSDWCVVLLAVCGTTRDARLYSLQSLLDTYEPDDRTVNALREFVGGGYVANPFCSTLLEVTGYASCRLAARCPTTAPAQPAGVQCPDMHELHRRMAAHPLAAGLITLAEEKPASGGVLPATVAPSAPSRINVPNETAIERQEELPLAVRFAARDRINPTSVVARSLDIHLMNVQQRYDARAGDFDSFVHRVYACEFEERHRATVGRVVTIHGADSRALEVAAEYVYVSASAGRRGRDWNLLARQLLCRDEVHYDQLAYERDSGNVEYATFEVAG